MLEALDQLLGAIDYLLEQALVHPYVVLAAVILITGHWIVVGLVVLLRKLMNRAISISEHDQTLD